MPFAPKICQDILKALEDQIIPALRSQKVLSLLAAPPFNFSTVKHWTTRKTLLPDNDKGPLQVLRNWPEHKLVSTQGIFLSFLYKGTMHRKVGALKNHGKLMEKQKLQPPPGIQIIKLTAPSCTIYADYAAREDGNPFQEAQEDDARRVRIMFLQNYVQISHSSREEGIQNSSHHLGIDDRSISQLGSMYLEELRLNHNHELAQTLLLAIMYRFRYNLLYKNPGISNSCWVNPEDASDELLSDLELKHQNLCADVIDYVQKRLQSSLSLKGIADHFGVSSFHLNNVFRRVHGTTLMRYVTDFRIRIAKRMLINTNERVNDIASLAGFASSTSFSHVFRNKTGMSPRQFRQEKSHNDR